MYAAEKHTILVVIYQLQNIALVLDLPAPVDVADGDRSRVGDLGDVLEPLVVVEEGEELSLVDRIEREQTSFSV